MLRLSLAGRAEKIASSCSLEFSFSAFRACVIAACCKNVLYQIPSLHVQDVLHLAATEFHGIVRSFLANISVLSSRTPNSQASVTDYRS